MKRLYLYFLTIHPVWLSCAATAYHQSSWWVYFYAPLFFLALYLSLKEVKTWRKAAPKGSFKMRELQNEDFKTLLSILFGFVPFLLNFNNPWHTTFLFLSHFPLYLLFYLARATHANPIFTFCGLTLYSSGEYSILSEGKMYPGCTRNFTPIEEDLWYVK